MRDAVGRGQPGRVADLHAPAKHTPAVAPAKKPAARAHEDRALLTHEPNPEPPPVDRHAARAQQVQILASHEVGEQSQGNPLRPALRIYPRRSTLRPPGALNR